MTKQVNIAGISGTQLRQFIERVERLEEEKKSIAEDIKEVYAEAKANGFDSKIMRKIISIRKMEAAEREEQETLIEVYKRALGMQSAFDFGDEEEEVDEKYIKKLAREHGISGKIAEKVAGEIKKKPVNPFDKFRDMAKTPTEETKTAFAIASQIHKANILKPGLGDKILAAAKKCDEVLSQ